MYDHISVITVSSSSVYLYAANDPIIKSSSRLRFAPYNLGYPGLKQHAEEAALSTELNKWELIYDFTKKDEDNFAVIPPEEWSVDMRTIPDVEGEPEMCFAYPERYGGTQTNELPKTSAETN